MLTVFNDDPRGFGRIVRGADGTVQAIVEEAVATPEQLALRELNVGAYCFNGDWLWEALTRIQKNPRKGEYYLTDAVELAAQAGLPVQAEVMDGLEAIGVNTRVHLAEVEAEMRRRVNEGHMLNGVTLVDPASTYIEIGVTIGRDTVVWPNTYLHGKTEIGEGNVIGPNTMIRDSRIENRCKVFASVLEGAWLESDVDMGPFARLRKGAHLGNHVHMGNFGEVKDSHLHDGVKMGHFSYVGNADIGSGTNIGAGTITCNYDGYNKHLTQIGAGAFARRWLVATGGIEMRVEVVDQGRNAVLLEIFGQVGKADGRAVDPRGRHGREQQFTARLGGVPSGDRGPNVVLATLEV